MDAARWQKIKHLYEVVSSQPIDGRASFLAGTAADDDELRREVERLLDQDLNTPALFVAAPPTGLHIPDLIGKHLGAFELTALIGRGGMGEVYRAHDTKLGRDVAIKVLPAGATADAARLAAFEHEARVLASLNHPHIGVIHGVEEHDGIRGLVLELVEGETLADVLRRFDTSDEAKLPVREALSWAHQIAQALEAAHEKGIIHRDLKPANIAITPGGVVKLLDFGIAEVVTGDEPESDFSRPARTIEPAQTGLVAGTPGYMSPEQSRGAPVDKRSDIWAFGCILYELLSGRRAFSGDAVPDTFTAIVDSEPDWSKLPGGTPRAIRRLLQRCLEKDPERRLDDIAHARLALERARRSRSGVWLGAAAAAAVVAVAGATLIRPGDRRPPGPDKWVQLTRFSDSVGQPSLSRDGRMLTFLRGATTFATAGEVYVKALPDGEPVQLTRDQTTKMSPVFSPDGSRIAYTVRDEGRWDTWQMPAGGGAAGPWLKNASGLTWLASNRLLFSEIKDENLHMAIVTSLENRTEARDVYVPERTSGMAHRSYVSPDGKSALIVEMVNGPWVPCRLISMDGTSPGRQVGPPNAGCTFAAWSPDGKWMYLSSNAGGGSHIWRQRFPDGAPEQVTFGPTEEDGIAMAPDGRSFITAVASRQSSVWVHGPDGDRQISIEGFAFDPRFSPDGKKLMYRILRGASLLEASELRITDLASGTTEPLLPGITIFGVPSVTYALSPDGREVVVAGFDAQGQCKLWLVPADRRSPPRSLPLSESDRFGLRGLSPDGRWVITLTTITGEESGVAGRAIVARSLVGERDVTLISSRADFVEMAVKWSADGRTVFFVPAALDRGMQKKTYAFPLAAGEVFPPIPRGGFRSEAEMANTPGARVFDVYDFAPGPAPEVYAYTRESVQRNLYRVPVR